MAEDLQTKRTQRMLNTSAVTDFKRAGRNNRDMHVLYAEGNERDSNHQQIQQIKVISAESPFMKESTKRCHLMNTTETSELNKHLQQ